MKRARKVFAMTAVLLVAIAAAARGQSALDGFDPKANGTVDVVVVQPDGKILIGGGLATLSRNGGAAVNRSRVGMTGLKIYEATAQ